MTSDIWHWDASATAAAIRAGKISSREAVEAALGRLREVNPAVNAVVETLEEEALAAADRADSIANRKAAGSLHGVPVTTKINVDLSGHATTNGLVAMKDALAAEDSAPVAALRRAGAIIIGRTNVPAFSYRWFTSNDLHGITKNPWNPGLSPGGSSGGAAAATAVGIGTLAHGNDVAGSLRLPASACGVYGIRPTVGRLPSYNPSQPTERSLCLQIGATEGLLARSVRDLRVGLTALEAQDHRDPWQTPSPVAKETDRLPCKVALFTGEREFGTAPEIVSTVRRAAAWLEQAGYVVEEVQLPHLAEIAELWMAMLYAECSGPVRETMYQIGDDAFRRSFADSVANFPVLDPSGLYRAWERRLSIQREWAVLLNEYPIALMPTSLQPTFPLDHDLAGRDALAVISKAFTPLSSIAGLALPAISVPAGSAAGAPAGVQIVSGRFMEERCLAAAAVMEQQIGKLLPIEPKVA